MADLAAVVSGHTDPLELIEAAIVAGGYGGDPQPPMLAYLAATTRLLEYGRGQMPAHLLLVGDSSSGKSFALQAALSLLPDDAVHWVDASSPRAFVYDNADIRHRVLVFSEQDSLPQGEDNPVASAIRNLLQDGRLHYIYTRRNAKNNKNQAETIDRPGPTVLLTTGTKALAKQLDTRVFSVQMGSDHDRLRLLMLARGRAAAGPPMPGVDTQLVQFQSDLQSQAPWRVVVPFAFQLAQHLAESIRAPRVLRDYERLLSLIRAVAVLRHPQRAIDEDGRLLAEVDDYSTVRRLLGRVFGESTGSAPDRVRRIVEAVIRLGPYDELNQSDVASHLGWDRMAVSRAVAEARRGGWLEEKYRGHGQADLLRLGDRPLEPELALPTPEALLGGPQPVTSDHNDCNGATDAAPDLETDAKGSHCNAITPDSREPQGPVWPPRGGFPLSINRLLKPEQD